MSKLIVEMEMPCNIQYLAGLHGTPTCPIEKRTCKDGNNPPKWCPIKGEISDIELMHLEEERAFAARNIAAERKDDGK